MNLLESNYEVYTSNCNQIISFKLVRNECDADNDKIAFNPQFTHQFFGEGEKIFGYKNPKIDFYFSASSLTPYFNFTYDEMIASAKDICADDVKKLLLEKIENVNYDLDSFKHIASNEKFPQFGKVIHQYTKENANGDKEVFEVCHVSGSELLSNNFKTLNDRLQYLLLFFVDGSSFIDITDESWEYFLIYEKVKECDGSWRHMVVGFLTAYNFFSYPDNVRQRISQVLVLPPFQRCGHGEQLLSAFYSQARANPAVADITVEDPSDQFQTLRDFVDCRNVLEAPNFDRDMVRRGHFARFSELARGRLKMTKKQIVHVYEILGLWFLDRSNMIEGVKYKQAVVSRLSVLFGKAKDYANSEAQAYLNMGQEHKATLIEREYERLEEYYVSIVNKLKRALP